MTERIFVALDVDGRERAVEVVRAIAPVLPHFKVGMELFYRCGPDIVGILKAAGAKGIFLDLKLHDIPNTVARATAVLAEIGVDWMTLHASGGRRMMEAAREQAEKRAAALGRPRPKLLAVTHLTSTDSKMLVDELGSAEPLDRAVIRLAVLARDSGMDGVVVSAQEVSAVRRVWGPDGVIVVPGIRPAFYRAEGDDQRRTATPAEALKRGADYLVVGRPILRSPDLRAAAEALAAECEGGDLPVSPSEGRP